MFSFSQIPNRTFFFSRRCIFLGRLVFSLSDYAFFIIFWSKKNPRRYRGNSPNKENHTSDNDEGSCVHNGRLACAATESMPDMDNLKGNAKEKVGEATGNKDLENEGKVDQAVGKVKEAAESVKDKLTGKD